MCVLAMEGWWWWGRRSLKTPERKNEGTRKARAQRIGKTVGRVAEERRRGVIKLETRNHTGGRILNDSPTATPAQQPSLPLSLTLSHFLLLSEMQLIQMEAAKSGEIEA